jgi:hypothetical protein
MEVEVWFFTHFSFFLITVFYLGVISSAVIKKCQILHFFSADKKIELRFFASDYKALLMILRSAVRLPLSIAKCLKIWHYPFTASQIMSKQNSAREKKKKVLKSW